MGQLGHHAYLFYLSCMSKINFVYVFVSYVMSSMGEKYCAFCVVVLRLFLCLVLFYLECNLDNPEHCASFVF